MLADTRLHTQALAYVQQSLRITEEPVNTAAVWHGGYPSIANGNGRFCLLVSHDGMICQISDAAQRCTGCVVGELTADRAH